MKKEVNEFISNNKTTIVILVLGFLILTLGKNTFNEVFPDRNQSIKSNHSEIGNLPSQSVEQSIPQESFVLSPGKPPQKIVANGKPVKWNWYYQGKEGENILLVRFHLIKKGGGTEITAWEDVANLGQLQPRQLPEAWEIKTIEFGVPKHGSTKKIEYAFL